MSFHAKSPWTLPSGWSDPVAGARKMQKNLLCLASCHMHGAFQTYLPWSLLMAQGRPGPAFTVQITDSALSTQSQPHLRFVVESSGMLLPAVEMQCSTGAASSIQNAMLQSERSCNCQVFQVLLLASRLTDVHYNVRCGHKH